MNKKILVVEDDQFFREALRDLLKKNYSVLEAPNGQSAKDILSMREDIDIVLTDIQMPVCSGIELLDWSKKNKPAVPFVIMTGFSTILETKSAYEMGAKGFIAKPFKNADLISTLSSILDPQNEKTVATCDIKDYCKVSIDEFVAKPKIDFDVYIRLAEDKIIKLAHKGEEIPREKLALYKEKGLRYLYILKVDFNKLISFNLGLAKIMKDRNEISETKKLNFLKYTGEVILERTFINGVDKESLNDAKSFLELTLSAVTEFDESLELLDVLNSHSDHIYAHSLGVSMYAVMIAKKFDIESPTTLYKLSMAGLFHDVGKKEIDRAILDKPRHLVSKAERAAIESHVVRGQEILNAMQSIPSDVIQLVLEHHEDQQNLGYPIQKHKFHQHPLSKILQCANIFIEQTLASANFTGKSAPEAIAHMESIYAGRMDPKCIKALKELFKID